MQLYQPVAKYLFLTWAKGLSCTYILPKLFTLLSETNTLNAPTTTSLCDTGIQMFFDNYFTAGNEAVPYNFIWAGSESN
jgi:hypothetical protein